jgi:hypothetical protein
MAWTNGPLTVYHGCNEASALSLVKPARPHAHGIDLSLCRRRTDFGAGFYTTTNPRQAREWANKRCGRSNASGAPPRRATVISFSVDRQSLAALEALVFIRDGRDFYDLVTYCRQGGINHARATGPYGAVFGPVSLPGPSRVRPESDQISFHTNAALRILSTPVIACQGDPLF